MRYVMGLDLGTTGVKALLIDERGRVVARDFVEYPLHHPKPGWAEQDPEDWWRATLESIRNLLGKSGVPSKDVACLGFSGQMHGSVLLDSDGRVLRPPILWCDVRTAEECREITEKVGRDRLLSIACNPALEGFTAPKLVWVQKHEPEIWEKTRWILLPKDYIRYRLTGEIAQEYSDAAGTLLLDVGKRTWAEPILEALKISPALLPPLYESSDIAGRILPEVSELTGVPAGMPVVAGGADNTCGAVGAGIVKEGRALSSIGSSGVVLAQTNGLLKDPLGRVHTFCHSIPSTWYVMGVMLAAGLSYKWFRDEFGQLEREVGGLAGIDAYDLLGAEAQQAPLGSGGVIFLPYLNGERTPHADANAKGVFFGFTTAHRRAHLVRSILEGVTFGLRDSLEILRGMGLEIDQLRAIGGGAKSPLWRQIQADVMNVEVATLKVDEGPAFGAALLAAVGAGIFSSVEEAAEASTKVAGVTEPIPENVRKYEEYYAVFRSLYPALKGAFREISRVEAHS